MKKSVKRALMLALVLVLALSLSGCMAMVLEYDFRPDGSFRMSTTTGYSEEILKALELDPEEYMVSLEDGLQAAPDMFSQIMGQFTENGEVTLPEGVSPEDLEVIYEPAVMTLDGMVYYGSRGTLGEQTMKLLADSEDTMKKEIYEEDGKTLIKCVIPFTPAQVNYTANGEPVPEDQLPAGMDMGGLIDMAVENAQGGISAGTENISLEGAAEAEQSLEELAAKLEGVDLNIKILGACTFPGGVISVEGMSEEFYTIEGNTVCFDLAADQYTEEEAAAFAAGEMPAKELTIIGVLEPASEPAQPDDRQAPAESAPAEAPAEQTAQPAEGQAPADQPVGTVPLLPFTDVAETDYFREAVSWAFFKDPQVTDGTTPTTFSPEKTCTRAQVVTFLWRAMGCPEPESAEDPFEDVAESDYFYKPVLWAIEKGITDGTSPTTFSPYGTCRNSHILTFVWRAVGEPGKTDAELWYADALSWANECGLLEGTFEGEYDVNADCPRANVIEYLFRYDTALRPQGE